MKPPSMEQMVEDLRDVSLWWRESSGSWVACIGDANADGPGGGNTPWFYGDSPAAALRALYERWKETEDPS